MVKATTEGTPPPRRPPGAGPSDRGELLAELTKIAGSAIEARWILEHVESEGRAGVTERARGLASRRAAGEPLQYVLGRWPFRTVELVVGPDVLIPRPETEHVVAVALRELAELHDGGSAGEPDRDGATICVDLGTGSGAIALSLAVEHAPGRSGVEIWATEASAVALVIAQVNLDALSHARPDAADRVRLEAGSWFDALPEELEGRVDLVISNPPYVSEAEYAVLDPVVREWEPRAALVAGAGRNGTEGLADVERIVDGASTWLRPGGVLVVELAPSQERAAVDVAVTAGLVTARVEPDLAGRPRVLVAVRP